MGIALSVILNTAIGVALFFGFLFLSLVLLGSVEYLTLDVSFGRAIAYIMSHGRGFFRERNLEARQVELGCRVRIALLTTAIEAVTLMIAVALVVYFGIKSWWISFGMLGATVQISLKVQTVVLLMSVIWALVNQVACMDTKLLILGTYIDGSYCDDSFEAFYTNVFAGGSDEPDCVSFTLNEREDVIKRYCDGSCFFAIMRDPNGDSAYISSLSIYN